MPATGIDGITISVPTRAMKDGALHAARAFVRQRGDREQTVTVLRQSSAAMSVACATKTAASAM